MGVAQYKFGDIVLIDLLDPQGQPCKAEHPAMIFRGPDEAGTAYVVAISTTFDEAEGRLAIDMPWAEGGHETTGLWRRCRMKCWWTCRIQVQSISRWIGVAPPDIAERALNYISVAVEERVAQAANRKSSRTQK